MISRRSPARSPSVGPDHGPCVAAVFPGEITFHRLKEVVCLLPNPPNRAGRIRRQRKCVSPHQLLRCRTALRPKAISAEGAMLMKSRTRVFMRVTLAIVFFFSVFLATTAMSEVAARDRGRDRCKRRCEERYSQRKNECRRFRGRERHRCEDEAKRERNDCKDRCR